MSKKKVPQTWTDKLEAASAKQLGKDIDADILKELEKTVAVPPRLEKDEDLGAILKLQYEGLKIGYMELEIRAKELEMGLYSAKARICQLELEKLKQGKT